MGLGSSSSSISPELYAIQTKSCRILSRHACHATPFRLSTQTSLENAQDRGAEDPFQRTLGVTSDTLALGAGSAPILVRDHGGLRRFRGVGAVDGGLACPSSVYVVVVSLTVDKAESKRQIKYW